MVIKRNLLIMFAFIFVIILTAWLIGFLSLDLKALDKGKKYFSGRVLECGSKHYVHGYSITELEGFKYYVKPRELSEIDKRNGLEWKGKVGFIAQVYRPLKDNKWGEFGEWDSGFGVAPNGVKGTSISIVKKNGKWHGLEDDPYKNDKSFSGVFASSLHKQFSLPEVNFKCDDLPE
jgi:hypothetical protein